MKRMDIIESVISSNSVSVRFVDQDKCVVFLPKDVDGLALYGPESSKNPRILARERTPYISKGKKENGLVSEDEEVQKPFTNLRIPNFQTKTFTSLGAKGRNGGRDNLDLSSGPKYDLELRKTQNPEALKKQIIGLTTGKKEPLEKSRSQSELHFPKNLSERKVYKSREVKKDEASFGPHSRDQANKNIKGELQEKIIEKNGRNRIAMEVEGIDDPKNDQKISLNHPETITSHITARINPDPSSQDKNFTQLYMDDQFKKVFGTKLAVTPNKVFGVNDTTSVKKGSSSG